MMIRAIYFNITGEKFDKKNQRIQYIRVGLIDAGACINLFSDDIYYFTENHYKFYGV